MQQSLSSLIKTHDTVTSSTVAMSSTTKAVHVVQHVCYLGLFKTFKFSTYNLQAQTGEYTTKDGRTKVQQILLNF